MPQARNAATLVQIARSAAQIMDNRTYRDGFTSDPDTATTLISVLGFVNIALGIFCRAGLIQGDFTVSSVVGQPNYFAPADAGRIVDVSYTQANGKLKPLRQTSLTDLNARKRNWREVTGEPNVFVAVGGQEFYLYPVPSAVRAIVLHCHKLLADLAATTDYPTGLPVLYHDALGHLAGMLLCASDSENEGNQARLGVLLNLWETAYADADAAAKARSLFADGSQPISRKEGGG